MPSASFEKNERLETHRVNPWNFMKGEPPEYLLSEILATINQYIVVLTISRAIVNKKRSVAPGHP